MYRSLRLIDPESAPLVSTTRLLDRRLWHAYRHAGRIARRGVVDRTSQFLPRATAVYNHNAWSVLNPQTPAFRFSAIEIEFNDVIDGTTLLASLSDYKVRRKLIVRHPLDGIALAASTMRRHQRCHDTTNAFLWARVVLQELIYLGMRDDYSAAVPCLWEALRTSFFRELSDGVYRVAADGESFIFFLNA